MFVWVFQWLAVRFLFEVQRNCQLGSNYKWLCNYNEKWYLINISARKAFVSGIWVLDFLDTLYCSSDPTTNFKSYKSGFARVFWAIKTGCTNYWFFCLFTQSRKVFIHHLSVGASINFHSDLLLNDNAFIIKREAPLRACLSVTQSVT